MRVREVDEKHLTVEESPKVVWFGAAAMAAVGLALLIPASLRAISGHADSQELIFVV